jgi:CxxC motif-containing protein
MSDDVRRVSGCQDMAFTIMTTMKNEKTLTRDCLKYISELKGDSPVNYGHVYLKDLWEKYGRPTVEKKLIELFNDQDTQR